MSNYVPYHVHSDLSNGVTNVDSVTKFGEYIERAKECGMTAFGFAEHGSVMEWYHKKMAIEAAGMKYLHGVECYLTEDMTEKIRDNYHCVLIARNYDGFLELNRLISKSFSRDDNHFYYTPRVSFDELFSTTDNILVTTACVGGVFGDRGSESAKEKFLKFMNDNKERCFFEIAHHLDEKQIAYNRMLAELSKSTGIRLIVGTDTHALNEEHAKGRTILQHSKNIFFDNEDKWDLVFRTYDELIEAFARQGSLPKELYVEALENTNLLADMVEPFSIDTGTKYPHIYDNPEETFRKKVYEAVESHPHIKKNHDMDDVKAVIDSELDVYSATKSIDFMLMQTYLREWEKEQGIQCGYGRGSVSGSMVAYALGITQMDSMKHELNFFRFMNPSRVTNADIDTDYCNADRERVKEFILRDKMNLPTIKSAEIITFNTIAMKGAIRDVCRALYKDSTDIKYTELASEIVKAAESNEDAARKKYPEVFKYVDIVSGTIVSIGTHPSGVVVSDLPIDEAIGLCSVSTSSYPVTMINMKELDALMYVKLDILGLDNIGIINDTCKTLGIDRLTPDNVDDMDEDVWRSIRDDTTAIFQWESNGAAQFLKKFMSDSTIEKAKKAIPNFSYIKWFSFGNGLIRPGCASFRDNVAKGEFYDNGFAELNEFLAPEAGRLAMQETIMQFLVRFCGYSDAESDTVRRGIAKKYGTEKLLPEIEERFIKYSSEHYDITEEKCKEVIKPFLQAILDASSYSFSWNHAEPYSYIGYISGYLRYYHPLEFITSALNTFNDDSEKVAELEKYAGRVGVLVTSPKWGISTDKYEFNSEKRSIAKGLASIKYIGAKLAMELHEASKQLTGKQRFVDVLSLISKETTIDTRQLDILIKIDFFSDFGNQRELLRITDMYMNMFKKGEVKKLAKTVVDGTPIEPIIKKYAVGVTKSGGEAKSYTMLDVKSAMEEVEDAIKDIGLPDIDIVIKAKNFCDLMGYQGLTTMREEDRPKLYVLNVIPLRRKKDGVQFGYSVITRSLGSGKETRFSLMSRDCKDNPIEKGDVIKCLKWTREGQYFRMVSFEKLYAGVS